ncbi:testis-expressed protein 13D-like [Eulemur rufifrons]|uniref:testis-expressed protein 13D-like n=1 Tax=Eulemur rufifrons TaxID=859984 RepID=UPI003743F6EF
MAVEFGDHASGFRHNEVIRFINNEVLMNGGSPDFYVAFRSRPWSEVEDRLRAVVADPQVPRALKRACAWSALALSVRLGARQQEQHTRRVRRLQEQVEERELASWTMVAELQRLRGERDDVAMQLQFTWAALQQAVSEREMLRGRLLQVQRSGQATPQALDIMPVMGAEQHGAAACPLNADQQGDMVAAGAQGGLYFEAQMPPPTGVLYVPGPPGPWAQAIQPPLPMPGPYPLPFQAPFPVGFPFVPPPPPAVVTEAGGAVVPFQMPPVGICPPGPWPAVGSQEEMAPLWYQRGYIEEQGSAIQQGSAPLGDSRSRSQEEGSQRPQGIPALGNSGNRSQGEDPGRSQAMSLLGSAGQHNQDNAEKPSGMASLGDSRSYSQEEGPEEPQGMGPLGDRKSQNQEEGPERPQGTVLPGDNRSHSQEEGPERPQKTDPLKKKSHSQIEGPKRAQGTTPLGDSRSYSQEDNPGGAQGMAPLEFSKSHSPEGGLERPQVTPLGDSWSHHVRESPKKQQPQGQKAKQPKGKKASESQQQEKPAPGCSPVNWVCPCCKAINYLWRTACYKCKKAFMPVESGDVNPGQTH